MGGDRSGGTAAVQSQRAGLGLTNGRPGAGYSPLKGRPVKETATGKQNHHSGGIQSSQPRSSSTARTSHLPDIPRQKDQQATTSAPRSQGHTSSNSHSLPAGQKLHQVLPVNSRQPHQQPLQQHNHLPQQATVLHQSTEVASLRRANGIERLKALVSKQLPPAHTTGGGPAAVSDGPALRFGSIAAPAAGHLARASSTAGFNSPDRQQEAAEVAREEMRQVLHRNKKKRLFKDEDLQAPGQPVADNSKGATEAQQSAQQQTREPWVRTRRTTNDSVHSDSVADLRPPSRDQAVAAQAADPPPLRGSISFEEVPSTETNEDYNSLSAAQFEEFKREVAARIIQAYWRKWTNWKLQTRKAAEQRMLQQLAASGLPPHLLQPCAPPAVAAQRKSALRRSVPGGHRVYSVTPDVEHLSDEDAAAWQGSAGLPGKPAEHLSASRSRTGTTHDTAGHVVDTDGPDDAVRPAPHETASPETGHPDAVQQMLARLAISNEAGSLGSQDLSLLVRAMHKSQAMAVQQPQRQQEAETQPQATQQQPSDVVRPVRGSAQHGRGPASQQRSGSEPGVPPPLPADAGSRVAGRSKSEGGPTTSPAAKQLQQLDKHKHAVPQSKQPQPADRSASPMTTAWGPVLEHAPPHTDAETVQQNQQPKPEPQQLHTQRTTLHTQQSQHVQRSSPPMMVGHHGQPQQVSPPTTSQQQQQRYSTSSWQPEPSAQWESSDSINAALEQDEDEAGLDDSADLDVMQQVHVTTSMHASISACSRLSSHVASGSIKSAGESGQYASPPAPAPLPHISHTCKVISQSSSKLDSVVQHMHNRLATPLHAAPLHNPSPSNAAAPHSADCQQTTSNMATHRALPADVAMGVSSIPLPQLPEPASQSAATTASPPCPLSPAAATASLTAEKMTSILRYLDAVEQQAEQEIAAVHSGAAAHLTGHVSSMLTATDSTYQPHLTAAAVARYTSPSSRPATAAAATATAAVASTSRPSTAGPPSRLHHNAQQPPYPASNVNLQPAASQRRHTSTSRYDSNGHAEDEQSLTGCTDGGGGGSIASCSVGAGAGSHAGGISTFLAETVYDNVRTKMRRLQEEVAQKDASLAALTREVAELQQQQRYSQADADAHLQEMLGAQRAEYEGAIARHLAFVDRLLADKDQLTAKCGALVEQVKSSEDRQEHAIAKLKDGWAAELRRQKEAWAASERVKREAWVDAKTNEIRDTTIKGMEGEVQKLLSKHRAELSAVQSNAGEDARRQLDAYIAQNELAVRQLKERLVKEQEEAIERERTAAQGRLREASERYEQQMQMQRMRLVADADLRMEQLEAARKEERRRHEEGISKAAADWEAREKTLMEDLAREKEAMRRAHDKQVEALREQYETGQEGWRAAIAERARKELADRESALRDKLTRERNEEIEVIMQRLEAESAVTREAAREEYRRREEALVAKHAAALKDAKRAEAKIAERFRQAGVAAAAADERAAAAEVALADAKREVETRNGTIRWLESQVSSAQAEVSAHAADLRSLADERAAMRAEAAAASQRDNAGLAARLAASVEELAELRRRHRLEMDHLEARVLATVQRKEETIGVLREQLAAAHAQMRETEAILAAQHAELDF